MSGSWMVGPSLVVIVNLGALVFLRSSGSWRRRLVSIMMRSSARTAGPVTSTRLSSSTPRTQSKSPLHQRTVLLPPPWLYCFEDGAVWQLLLGSGSLMLTCCLAARLWLGLLYVTGMHARPMGHQVLRVWGGRLYPWVPRVCRETSSLAAACGGAPRATRGPPSWEVSFRSE